MKRFGNGAASLANNMRTSSVAAVRGRKTSGIWMKVRHELTARVLECDAAQEMRDDPSEPAYRSRLQTASSCSGKEPLW